MAGIYIHIPFCKQACYYCDFHFSTSLKKKEEMLEGKEKMLEAQSPHSSMGGGMFNPMHSSMGEGMFNPMNGMLGEPHIIRLDSLDDSPSMPPPGIFNMLDSIMRDKIRTGPVQSHHFGPIFPMGHIMRPGPHPSKVG